MTVIRKPQNAPPLFGGRSFILLGAFDKEGMRRWQDRLRNRKAELAAGGNKQRRRQGQDDIG